MREAVLEKLNSSGKVPTVDCIPRNDEFEFEEVVSLDKYDAGPRSVLETDAIPDESQAKRPCNRSQVEREAKDLRNIIEQSRTFRRETGLMNFRADRLGPPVRTWSSSGVRDSYRSPPGGNAERRRRRDSRPPARDRSRAGKLPRLGEPVKLATAVGHGSVGRTTSRGRKQVPGMRGDAKGRGPRNAGAGTRPGRQRFQEEERWNLCGSCTRRTSWMPLSRRRWRA